MSQLQIGDKSPIFSLDNQNSKNTTLSAYKCHKLLVYFYPKANTPGCTKQSCDVSENLTALKKLGVAAIGISPDDPAKQQKFDEKYNLNFPLLCDTDHKIAEAYGVWGEKLMYGKKYHGIIRSSFLVDEKGKLIGVWYKVKPLDTVSNVKKLLA